ncbi:MAG: ApaG domain [Candidatus Methylacidiphilales bacterium]
MPGTTFELEGFTAQLEKLEYVPSSTTPAHRPHQFTYSIILRNDSLRRLRVLSRKWVLTSSQQETLVVEGEGVVGQYPDLSPGQTFHYTSFHLIKGNTMAAGMYFAEDEDGNRVAARLTPFKMVVPTSESVLPD